jgi:hypothetical protein
LKTFVQSPVYTFRTSVNPGLAQRIRPYPNSDRCQVKASYISRGGLHLVRCCKHVHSQKFYSHIQTAGRLATLGSCQSCGKSYFARAAISKRIFAPNSQDDRHVIIDLTGVLCGVNLMLAFNRSLFIPRSCITLSVLRRVHNLFQSDFSIQCDRVFPLPIASILYCP